MSVKLGRIEIFVIYSKEKSFTPQQDVLNCTYMHPVYILLHYKWCLQISYSSTLKAL